MGKDDIVEVGEGADNGVFDNGIIDAGFFADGHVGSDYGITDVAARSDADGLKDDGILELVLRGNGAAEFLEQFGIGLEKSLFFAAVEPILDFKGMEFDAAADHAFDGVGKVVFPVAGDLIADIGLQAIEQCIGLPDAVDADQGHIRLGYLGFFDDALDAAVVLQFGHPEIPGVVDPFYAQKGMGLIEHILYLVFADGVAEYDEDLVLPDDASGEENGMTDALAFVLVNKMNRQLGIFLPYEVLDLFSQVTYDKDKFVDSGFHQLVNYDRENGLAGQWDQSFWLRIRMRT